MITLLAVNSHTYGISRHLFMEAGRAQSTFTTQLSKLSCSSRKKADLKNVTLDPHGHGRLPTSTCVSVDETQGTGPSVTQSRARSPGRFRNAPFGEGTEPADVPLPLQVAKAHATTRRPCEAGTLCVTGHQRTRDKALRAEAVTRRHRPSCGDTTNLVDEGVVHEVGAADAEVQHVHLLQDGVIEGVQEPGGVGHLVNRQT